MGRATAKEEREIKADRGILELGEEEREGEAVSASTNARRTDGRREHDAGETLNDGRRCWKGRAG